MNVQIDFSEAQVVDIAAAVIREMERQGKVMVEPERMKPYTLREAVEHFGVSDATLSRWAEAGRLHRVPGTGRVLFTAASVRALMAGEISA